MNINSNIESTDCQTVRAATRCFGRALTHTTVSGTAKTWSATKTVSSKLVSGPKSTFTKVSDKHHERKLAKALETISAHEAAA